MRAGTRTPPVFGTFPEVIGELADVRIPWRRQRSKMICAFHPRYLAFDLQIVKGHRLDLRVKIVWRAESNYAGDVGFEVLLR